jgi:hypothetical protein
VKIDATALQELPEDVNEIVDGLYMDKRTVEDARLSLFGNLCSTEQRVLPGSIT